MIDSPALQLLGIALLAFTRICLIFVQAPITGSDHINTPTLAGFAVATTAVIYPTLHIPPDVPNDLFQFFLALLTQACVGLILGYTSFIVIAAAQFGGELLDIQMGLSSAASFDPASHGAINLIRKLLFYTAMNLYLTLGGHYQLFAAIHRSFEVIPVTYFHISENLAMYLIKVSSDLLVIGTQMAAPALAALLKIASKLTIPLWPSSYLSLICRTSKRPGYLLKYSTGLALPMTAQYTSIWKKTFSGAVWLMK